MKAAIYDRYGPADVLQIAEIARPEIKDNEVLVQVYASSVTTADWRIRASAFPGYAWLPGRMMFGLFRPRNKVLGMEFAGRVVAKGNEVTRFRGGDAVFGFAPRGAHAEYLAMPQDGPIMLNPDNLSYEDAAAVPFGALSALVFLRDFARVAPGQKVLVHGASGGIGIFAVQLAKHFGAEVTGVASGANLDLLRALGADHVIDYTQEDFTQSARKWDLVFDTVGKTRFATVKRVLTETGIYLPLEFGFREILLALVTSRGTGKRVKVGVSGDSSADLEMLAGLLKEGAIRPVIDSTYPLESIAEAYRRVEGRHKRGSVVVAVGQPQRQGSTAA
ncbi:MAG: NAD(P)-dependent alcohol dehydrogenase [Paracoccaceae bacterium]